MLRHEALTSVFRVHRCAWSAVDTALSARALLHVTALHGQIEERTCTIQQQLAEIVSRSRRANDNHTHARRTHPRIHARTRTRTRTSAPTPPIARARRRGPLSANDLRRSRRSACERSSCRCENSSRRRPRRARSGRARPLRPSLSRRHSPTHHRIAPSFAVRVRACPKGGRGAYAWGVDRLAQLCMADGARLAPAHTALSDF